MEDIKFQFNQLLFGVRRSVRYHNRRRAFFDRFHKISTFLSALAGTATVASVLASFGKAWTITFAVAVTVFSVVDLVVGTARAARAHNDLARRFIELEKKMICINDPAQADLDRLTGMRLDIEQDEPPPLKVLDSICHNELLRAMGYGAEKFVEIKWYQRIFAQLFDVREHLVR